MIKIKIFTVLIAFKNLICPCAKEIRCEGFEKSGNTYKIIKAGKLPKAITESSGLEIADTSNAFWTHNDSGAQPLLYKISASGQLLDELYVKGARNKDWEDLTKDERGNIYIGDFGNNANRRKDLKIYKVNSNRIDSISFSLSDQVKFPPEKSQRNFDLEAFFWYKDSLYLFSKNRGNKIVKFYRLPDRPGTYSAELIGSVKLQAMITAADVSPDGKEFALLGYGKIYLFRNTNSDSFAFQSHLCKRFARSGQAEGIVYIDNDQLLITNEGGKIFKMFKK